MLLALVLTACDGPARTALAAARADAGARRDDPGEDWEADASLTFPLFELERLSVALLDDVLERAPGVAATLPGGRATVSLDPRFHVDGIALVPHPTRSDRLLARGELEGTLGASLGGRSVGLPVRVDLELSLRLDVVDQSAVMVRLDEIESIRVEAFGRKSEKARKGRGVEEFLRARLAERPPQAFISRIGEGALPLLGARLVVDGDVARIELRTDTPGAPPPLPRLTPTRGVTLAMTDSTLTALVRREAFAHAEGTYVPFIEPVTLDVGDGRFSGAVRLWNPGWPAWWQEFDVAGPIDLDEDGVHVGFTEIRPRAGSGWFGSGHMLAEPAREALGNILGGRLTHTLPGQPGKSLNTVRLDARLQALRDLPGGFVVEAWLETRAPPRADR